MNPSLWIKSVYTSLEEERLQQVADSVTLVDQRQAALDIKRAELDCVNAEYKELKAEVLLPKQKPKGFTRTPVGKSPAKPKTGWFNKTLALLSAFHLGDDKGVEGLIEQRLVLVIKFVVWITILHIIFSSNLFCCFITHPAGTRLISIRSHYCKNGWAS